MSTNWQQEAGMPVGDEEVTVAGYAASAEESAQTATDKAGEASSSASSASASATSASTSASNAASSAATATTKASEATTAASNASISEINASTSEANASASAVTATAKASEATTAASSATASATTASISASAAETAYDNFDDRYLGAKASDPALDNDGDALITGALYFNSTSGEMKVYTGSAWVAAYVTLGDALLPGNNLSDLDSASAARTNLGLGSAATTDSTAYATSAQGTSADTAFSWGDHALVGYVQPNDNVALGELTVTNLVDTVYTLAGTDIDPANGNVQTKALSADTTFTESLASGESVVLMLTGGDSHTVTFPTITWTGSTGNTAPTLTASDAIVFWKVGSTLYGAYVGSYA